MVSVGLVLGAFVEVGAQLPRGAGSLLVLDLVLGAFPGDLSKIRTRAPAW